MQDEGQGGQEVRVVWQFINYANKSIRHGIRDFDKEWDRRHDIEFMTEDGDLPDSPSVSPCLVCDAQQGIYLFWRSDGSGQPLKIQREDLALALDELTVEQQDAIVKIFQEKMPMKEYATEQGISRSTAHRRMRGILDHLLKSIRGRMEEDESKDQEERRKTGKTERAATHHRTGHTGSTKR